MTSPPYSSTETEPEDEKAPSSLERERHGWVGKLESSRFVWAIVFLVMTLSLFIPAVLYAFAGLVVYLWIIPLANVPVIALQAIPATIAAVFSLTLSKKIIDTLKRDSNGKGAKLDRESHLLRLSAFMIAFFGSPIYFWHVISLAIGSTLLWRGRKKIWQALGLVAMLWVVLVQLYIFTTLWR
jgi:hypothetical protein